MGNRDGNENTSAGQSIIRATNMLNNPINEAAIKVGNEMFIPGLIRKNTRNGLKQPELPKRI